jgi:hypothetical protein
MVKKITDSTKKALNFVLTGSKTASIADISEAVKVIKGIFVKAKINHFFGTGSYGAGILCETWADYRPDYEDKFSFRKVDWNEGRMAAKKRNADLIRDGHVLLLVGPIDHNGDYYLNRDWRMSGKPVIQVVEKAGGLMTLRDEPPVFGPGYKLPKTVVRS